MNHEDRCVTPHSHLSARSDDMILYYPPSHFPLSTPLSSSPPMSAFLNKLRRPSTSADSRTRRSTSSSTVADDTGQPTSQQAPSSSPQRTAGASGSVFIENFDQSPQPSQPGNSPRPSYADSSSPHPKHHSSPMPEPRRTPTRPSPLQVPDSGPRTAGTPKLMLTQEGSTSPHSVSDHSPIYDYHKRSPSQSRNHVGLGLEKPNLQVSSFRSLPFPFCISIASFHNSNNAGL